MMYGYQLHEVLRNPDLSLKHQIEQFKELFDIPVFPDPILDKDEDMPEFVRNLAPIENKVLLLQLAVTIIFHP